MRKLSRRVLLHASTSTGQAAQFPVVLHGSTSDRKFKLGLSGCGWDGLADVEAATNFTAGVENSTPQNSPASLGWDFWYEPLPLTPYNPQVGHKNWRLEQAAGHGRLVDWGIHLIDAAPGILGDGVPPSVSESGGLYELKGKSIALDVLTVHFESVSCPLMWRHRYETGRKVVWDAEHETVLTNSTAAALLERENRSKHSYRR